MITGREKAGVDRAVRSLAEEAGDASRVAGCVADVRDRNAVDQAVRATVDQLGGLNVLVNNAGIGIFKEVTALSDEDWDRVLGTNLSGVFYSCRAAVPEIKRAGGGWIINIASLAARNYFATDGAYCASKAGLLALSESLMLEVREAGIRVTVIMPGAVATEFSSRREGGDDSWKLTPADVAAVVSDLLQHPPRSLPSKIEIRPAKTK